VQVDLLRAEQQRGAGAAIGYGKRLLPHPQRRVEPAGRRDVGHRQDKVVQRFDVRLCHGFGLSSVQPMQNETRTATVQDMMDPARADALLVALGRDPLGGDALPPFFHHLYFWEPQPPAQLGRDGHPRVGRLIPDMGLPRRMWAGGRLTFHAPLRVGVKAERRTRVDSTAHKVGCSGPLGFVTLRHEIWQEGVLCVTEFQDLVYRTEAGGARPQPPEAPEAGHLREVTFDTTLLFRYSALTFNGHRIHYDEDYARGVEGYDGLVVHGPLLAQLLMLEAGPLHTFSFRATAPLMHHEAAVLCRDGARMWVRGPEGRLCMTAELG